MKKEINIADKKIGDNYPTYIIAEIGSNHNRNIETAKKLIDYAAKAGVDAVKFQTYKAEKMYSKKTPYLSELKINPFEMVKSIELPREWHEKLFDYSLKNNLHFLSTPFDFEAVDELDSIGVPAFKVSSFEITDLEFIRFIASKKKPIILSTGMASLGEIEDAMNIIISEKNDDIILLHCNSVYPTNYDIVNLNAISTLSSAFKIPVGFSDHTLGIHISLAAVTIGAKVIEKHFTLNRKNIGPDHSFALEPNELKKMVENIRDIEKSLGNGVKKKTKEEKKSYEIGRRSIIAKKDIKKGTKITRDMLIVKRPGLGIKPKLIDLVIGRTAKKDIESDEWITWDMI